MRRLLSNDRHDLALRDRKRAPRVGTVGHVIDRSRPDVWDYAHQPLELRACDPDSEAGRGRLGLAY
jgi:hypothetical protein